MTDQLSRSADDEENKREKRLVQNRLSALKCRQKKKQEAEQIEVRLQRLQQDNQDLKR